jgi:hypothetical protein
MDRRRLIGGLAVVVLLVGVLLALFSPRGAFNSGAVRESLDTPIGTFSRTVGGQSSPWPVVGYVLAGVGAVGLVVAFALKPPKA